MLERKGGDSLEKENFQKNEETCPQESGDAFQRL